MAWMPLLVLPSSWRTLKGSCFPALASAPSLWVSPNYKSDRPVPSENPPAFPTHLRLIATFGWASQSYLLGLGPLPSLTLHLSPPPPTPSHCLVSTPRFGWLVGWLVGFCFPDGSFFSLHLPPLWLHWCRPSVQSTLCSLHGPPCPFVW